jgi:uncharacterized protein (TIGR04255 family)
VHYRANLPDFANPPVIETVLSVEFAPLYKWSIPHFGLFWNAISTEYPRFEVHPPLASQIESFDKRKSLPRITVEPVIQPPIRCWFIHQSDARLLQVQNDRFTHNWRKVGTADPYPRYESIRPIFEAEWARFREFLEAQNIGTPQVRQCEVSYVNHLDPGRGWQSLADLPDIVGTRVGARTDHFLPVPESVSLAASYVMPNEHGRLHVQLLPVIRQADAAETLQLTLTARGRPASSQTEDILRWFDLGREWVVRGFADVTTSNMHAIWQRRQ